MLKLSSVHSLTDIRHFTALKHRDYRYSWAANMSSGAGMWISFGAVQWMALEESDSSGWVGIITFAIMIPYLLVAPIAGLMADRLDRRKLAIFSLAGGAINLAVLAALALAGLLQLWHVALLMLSGAAFRVVQESVIQALVPNQVPRQVLLNAITLNAASRHGAKLVLGMTAPFLAVGLVDVRDVLIVSAFFQSLSVVLMTRTATVSRGEARTETGLIRSMAEGLTYIYSNRVIALFIILVAFHCALVMSFDSLLPVLSRDNLGDKEGSVLFYLVMAFGAGALMGTLLMAGVRSELRKGQLFMWTALVSGLTPLVLAWSTNVPLAVLSVVGMGASQGTFMVITNTYVQTVAPDRLRGRISSLYLLHAGGIMAFSNLGYGFMGDIFSAPPVLFVAALVFIVVLLALYAGEPVLRRVYQSGQVSAAVS